MPTSDDLRAACDAMQCDMAAHQARFKGEVTAASNQSLAADAAIRMENEARDAPTSTIANIAPDPVPTRQERRRLERKEVDGRRYVVETVPDEPMYRRANEGEAWFLAHAMPRIELLLTKVESGLLGAPSWRQRVLATMSIKARVMPMRLAGANDVADDLEQRFLFELMRLLDDSGATFGDWKADAPTKVYG